MTFILRVYFYRNITDKRLIGKEMTCDIGNFEDIYRLANIRSFRSWYSWPRTKAFGKFSNSIFLLEREYCVFETIKNVQTRNSNHENWINLLKFIVFWQSWNWLFGHFFQINLWIRTTIQFGMCNCSSRRNDISIFR